MQALEERLQSLDNIGIAIRNLRNQENSIPLSKETVDDYFKKHLSIQDWIFWKKIQTSW